MSTSPLAGSPREVRPPAGASETMTNRICEISENRWGRGWTWASERINPIVVKEIRQSLKSKQFTISFGATLIAAVAWTLIAISLMVPRIFYIPGGVTLLAGFYCILAVPLMVIIPFGAFRSLTSETEDSTFELLSISALSSSQIIYGKMASACMQIMLYLSALAPCIVLTYVLRGVSLFTIAFLLGITVLFSVCETALALLLAAVSRTRMVQTGASVVVLAGLLMSVIGWTSLLIEEGLDTFDNPPSELYIFLLASLVIVVVAMSLVLRAAAAAIDFPSENHSTSLRWRIIALQGLIVFWSLLGIVAMQEGDFAIVLLTGFFVASMLLGGLISGEHGIISLRAQRSLPKTFMGRVFLTWFYPGAGLGYIYLVCQYAALWLTLAGFELFHSVRGQSLFGNTSIAATGYLLLCYLVIYVGIVRLLMLGLSKHFPARMLGSFAMLVVLLIMAHLVPWVVVFYFNDYRDFPYDWHQAFNIFLSVAEANDRLSLDIGPSIIMVTLCAIGVFGLNLLLCTRDIMLVRVALPPRVREEEGLSDDAPEALADPFAD